jgi:hypothetical protein
MSTAVEQASAVAAMPADMAILKLENETIQSLAAARPRNHESIKGEIVAQLQAYPSFAKAAIYSKPVGKDPETGRQKLARGLSVRAAEAIAEAYGYCRIRTDVSPVDDNTVKVEASFTDYQKGRIWQDGGLVSKFYRDKYGKMQRIPDDRFYNVVVKAEVSRRVREVILRSVPPGLRSELQEMAERQMATLLDEKGVNAIVAYFDKLGVKLEQLEAYIGRTVKSGWTEEDRLDLHGLANAIKDGETTIAEAFGDGTGTPKAPTGPVKAEDLSKPNGNGSRRDPTGAHADLPGDHGKQPLQSETPPSPEAQATDEPPPSDEDILNDVERELAALSKLT